LTVATTAGADADSRSILAALEARPTLAGTIRAVRALEGLSDLDADMFSRRSVIVLRNYTVEPMEPQMKVAAFRSGLRLTIRYSDYQVGPGRTLDDLLADRPDAVFVALRLEELAPALSRDVLDTDPARLNGLASAAVDQVVDLVRAVRHASAAAVFVHNFVPPLVPAAGLSDSQDPLGQLALVRRMNVQLVEELHQVDGAFVLDIDHLLSSAGLEQSTDERGARLASAPLSAVALNRLAEFSVRHLAALSGPAIKCVVVDCDGTLWGGTIGEDGIAGLVLGGHGTGRSFRDLQQGLRDLRRRGTVLALCSWNEEADVREVFSNHPDCVLGWNDFAAHRVNWTDKAENIVAIADELNLSLEHLLFIDDDPWQCELVRGRLPELRVLRWPDDFAGVTSLQQLAYFDSLTATAEDASRTEMYLAETARRALRDELVSPEDFLRSLQLVARVGWAEPGHLPRLAQLTQRTNQFNLTTRRYDVAELAEAAQAPDTRVMWVELEDRLGSYGLVGCAIIRLDSNGVAHIDTFLLSCRILGRDIEWVVANRAASCARALGAKSLIGVYVPSERNEQVADLYSRLGFHEISADGDARRWEWAIPDGLPAVPEWIEVEDVDGGGGGDRITATGSP
jgi:FkbH-like protein